MPSLQFQQRYNSTTFVYDTPQSLKRDMLGKLVLMTCNGPANREGHHGGDPDCECYEIKKALEDVLEKWE